MQNLEVPVFLVKKHKFALTLIEKNRPNSCPWPGDVFVLFAADGH